MNHVERSNGMAVYVRSIRTGTYTGLYLGTGQRVRTSACAPVCRSDLIRYRIPRVAGLHQAEPAEAEYLGAYCRLDTD